MLAVAGEADDLRHVAAEASAVVRAAGGRALQGAEQTVASVLETARRHRYLHIAAHARFDAEEPLQSGLQLGSKYLSARTLLQTRPLDMAFVSISGCESGVSLVRPGDELLGLLRALLHSVAPSVLLTLWPIEDFSAYLFADCFYRRLASRNPATPVRFSRILREAVNDLRNMELDTVHQVLRRDGLSTPEVTSALASLPRAPDAERPFDHPAFWAAFALVGEIW